MPLHHLTFINFIKSGERHAKEIISLYSNKQKKVDKLIQSLSLKMDSELKSVAVLFSPKKLFFFLKNIIKSENLLFTLNLQTWHVN